MNTSVKVVKIADIGFAVEVLRTHKEDADHIIQTKESLVEHGLLNLPKVAPDADNVGKYFVLDGANRLTAMKQLVEEGKFPKEHAFMVVDKPMTPLEIISAQVAGNATVHKTMNKEYIQALHRMATEGKMSLETLSKKSSMSISYIMRLFKTLRLPESVLELAKENKLTVVNLITLSDLAGKVEESELLDWCETAKTATAKELAPQIQERLDVIKQSGKKDTVVGFVLTNKLVKKEVIEAMFVKEQNRFASDSSKENAGRFAIMQELFQVDAVSATARESAFDKKKADAAVAKDKRKADKEIKNKKEYIEKLKAEGFKITK